MCACHFRVLFSLLLIMEKNVILGSRKRSKTCSLHQQPIIAHLSVGCITFIRLSRYDLKPLWLTILFVGWVNQEIGLIISLCPGAGGLVLLSARACYTCSGRLEDAQPAEQRNLHTSHQEASFVRAPRIE